MLDRESTFADDRISTLLRQKFVPVAIDVFYHERRQDAEGGFYRQVVQQRPGLQPGKTTQGFYIFTADGTLISGWNNRDPAKVLKLLQTAAARESAPKSTPKSARESAPKSAQESARESDLGGTALPSTTDPRYARTPPVGGLVVDVHAKVLDAHWRAAATEWTRILRSSRSRDHLWLTGPEVAAVARGEWPDSLTRRITRFHLIDNTRGEPPMWRSTEVEAPAWRLTREDPAGAYRLLGTAKARTDDGKRGYDLAVRGRIVAAAGKLQRFELVARGEYWGGGRYSSNDLPAGRFDFAVAFSIATDGAAAEVPPQGARDLHGYLDPR